MSARQISFSNRAADTEAAGESCSSRRQFILAFGLKAAVLTSVLTACGKRGDLKPPPQESETPSTVEKDDVQ